MEYDSITLIVALSMAVIYYFCKRQDEIEYREKYGRTRKETRQFENFWKQQINK